ncbi:MAG: BRCT domain-containing protein [Planctomycetota bacterium]
MAGSRQTPGWMSSLIVFAGLLMLTSLGFFLYYYGKSAQMYEEWHRLQDQREALDLAKLPLQQEIEGLEKEFELHAGRLASVEAAIRDERNGIDNLHGQQDVLLNNIRTSIDQIQTKRRELLQTIEEVREEWSREEDLMLSNAGEHEESLRRLRDQVKQISHDIEREQKNARTVQVQLERDIQRLEERVAELVDQKEYDRTELTPDGSITAARANLGFVIIDLGWEDNLRPGTKFQVFASRGGRNLVKGQVQVVRVEERIAHARILAELDPNDPIIVGDQLHNPIYDPTETKVFVIKGDFSRYSPAELARFIQEAGGKVEDELTTRTNFLVAGENSDIWLEQATNYGVIILSENKLIEFIRMPEPTIGSTLDLAAQAEQ